MTLLTDDQINAASTEALYKTVGAIQGYLGAIETDRLLQAAATWRTDHAQHDVTRILVETADWDFGTYFNGRSALTLDADGAEVRLEGLVWRSLARMLDGPLTSLSLLSGPLGPNDTLAIDLSTNRVSRIHRIRPS